MHVRDRCTLVPEDDGVECPLERLVVPQSFWSDPEQIITTRPTGDFLDEVDRHLRRVDRQVSGCAAVTLEPSRAVRIQRWNVQNTLVEVAKLTPGQLGHLPVAAAEQDHE